MPFTAGSPELTKAIQFAVDAASLRGIYGLTAMSGRTAAVTLEKLARNYGFGITGITTGSSFPPFGSFYPSLGIPITAVLQNPRGETMASGITLGAIEGQTVGIYLKKFVRSGEDYRATIQSGITLAKPFSVGDTGISANGPFLLHRNDRLVFNVAGSTTSGGNVLIVGGSTSGAVSGASGNIPLLQAVSFSAVTGDIFIAETIGITRGTSGIAGSTFERFGANNFVNRGFTAAIYYDFIGTTTGITWSIS